jgi:hypothetical protein
MSYQFRAILLSLILISGVYGLNKTENEKNNQMFTAPINHPSVQDLLASNMASSRGSYSYSSGPIASGPFVSGPFVSTQSATIPSGVTRSFTTSTLPGPGSVQWTSTGSGPFVSTQSTQSTLPAPGSVQWTSTGAPVQGSSWSYSSGPIISQSVPVTTTGSQVVGGGTRTYTSYTSGGTTGGSVIGGSTHSGSVSGTTHSGSVSGSTVGSTTHSTHHIGSTHQVGSTHSVTGTASQLQDAGHFTQTSRQAVIVGEPSPSVFEPTPRTPSNPAFGVSRPPTPTYIPVPVEVTPPRQETPIPAEPYVPVHNYEPYNPSEVYYEREYDPTLAIILGTLLPLLCLALTCFLCYYCLKKKNVESEAYAPEYSVRSVVYGKNTCDYGRRCE